MTGLLINVKRVNNSETIVKMKSKLDFAEDFFDFQSIKEKDFKEVIKNLLQKNQLPLMICQLK